MPNPEKLDSLATSFDRVLNVEGKSPRTRVLYAQSITYLSDWLTAQGHPADLCHQVLMDGPSYRPRKRPDPATT